MFLPCLLSACLRDDLAPLALDAYPEAYHDFKGCLGLLLSAKDKAEQSRTALSQMRNDLASSVYQAAWHSLGLREPTLLPLLTYLLHLHHVFRSSVADRQLQEQELVDQLLHPLAPRDCPPLPAVVSQSSSAPAAAPREADVQALIQCTGTTRRDATDALRRPPAAGSAALAGNGTSVLMAAFLAEISRLRLDRRTLRTLLNEYIAFRGLEANLDEEGDPGRGGQCREAVMRDEGPAARVGWLSDDENDCCDGDRREAGEVHVDSMVVESEERISPPPEHRLNNDCEECDEGEWEQRVLGHRQKEIHFLSLVPLSLNLRGGPPAQHSAQGPPAEAAPRLERLRSDALSGRTCSTCIPSAQGH